MTPKNTAICNVCCARDKKMLVFAVFSARAAREEREGARTPQIRMCLACETETPCDLQCFVTVPSAALSWLGGNNNNSSSSNSSSSNNNNNNNNSSSNNNTSSSSSSNNSSSSSNNNNNVPRWDNGAAATNSKVTTCVSYCFYYAFHVSCLRRAPPLKLSFVLVFTMH